jgi:hypothetical protein
LRAVKAIGHLQCGNRGMDFPAFFAEVPALRVHDELAEVLGSAAGGILEFRYADAVRLTGHSCPTVASAYWLARLALQHLYGDGLPERGGVRVEFREDARSGSTGVVATVVQMLTGAAGGSGFKGLGGRFARAGLQRFVPELPLSMRFTRLDNRAAVDVTVDLSLLPEDERLDALLDGLLRRHVDAADLHELGERWQRRVRALLIELRDDPAVFIVRPVERRAPVPQMLPPGRSPLPGARPRQPRRS